MDLIQFRNQSGISDLMVYAIDVRFENKLGLNQFVINNCDRDWVSNS